jgi:hypothetical protein
MILVCTASFPSLAPGVGCHYCWFGYTRVLKNNHQAVSQGVRRIGKRSPPEVDEHLQ